MKTYSAILIWDLDATLVDSSHRTPNNPDGTLNLAAYIEKHTPDNIAKDTALPLLRCFLHLITQARFYSVVCTARDMMREDYDSLRNFGIATNQILSRDQALKNHYRMHDGEYKRHWMLRYYTLKQFVCLPKFVFDDAAPVLSMARKLPNTVALNAVALNKKLLQKT